MAHEQNIKVCIIAEGSYPYIMGGVSIWLHELISSLPQIHFILWTIAPEKGKKFRFKLPDNVVGFHEIALSEKLKSGKRRHGTSKQWHIVQEFHNKMREGNYNDFFQFYQQFSPENSRSLTVENIFKDFQGWQILTDQYQLNHPISPFINYYWAWRAVHIPMFQMLQADIPDADIYHSVSTGYAGLLASIAKIRTGKPFILTEHGIYAKERELEINQSELYLGYSKKMWKRNFHSLAKIAYTYSDLIIALYRKNQEIQIRLGASPEKCRVIPNGIHIEEFADLQPKPHQGFNVGLIGRMVAIKDIKNFIMAARIILQKIPNARFYLIGPRSEQEEYFKELTILIENLQLTEHVVFTGRVDVKEYLPLLDVLCLTSVKEAQPLTIIEGMVAGVPVVATDVGDVSDLLQDNGIVVPPKSPDKLAEGVIRFATDEPFRQQCIKNARMNAIQRYNIDDLIREYNDLYYFYAKSEATKWQA